MQPFVNVYTRFPRADGHTVWLHNDQWEGQDWKRSPGNLFGDPVEGRVRSEVRRRPFVSSPTRPSRQFRCLPTPTMVKRIKISEHDSQQVVGTADLSRRDRPAAKRLRHASRASGIRSITCRIISRSTRPAASAAAAISIGSGCPTVRRGSSDVTLQHPSPYYDDSYGVDSENNGPYGEAIIKELIPAVEEKFRAIREPWARMLSGGSTGGWIALAHQVLYPDFYGGSFAQLSRLGRLLLSPDRQHLQRR